MDHDDENLRRSFDLLRSFNCGLLFKEDGSFDGEEAVIKDSKNVGFLCLKVFEV